MTVAFMSTSASVPIRLFFHLMTVAFQPSGDLNTGGSGFIGGPNVVTIKGADYCVEGEHSVDMVFCQLIYQTVMRWHFQVAKKTIQMSSVANILLREFLSSELRTLTSV